MHTSFGRCSLFYVLLLLCVAASLSAFAGAARAGESDTQGDARVADACARGSDGGSVWRIGTRSIEMTFDGRGGAFRLVSFLNKSCNPPLEYVDAKSAAAPFTLDWEGFLTKPTDTQSSSEAEGQWKLRGGVVQQVVTGGRPAVQLDLTLTRGGILARFHIMAFPGTSILRQWVEIENSGSQPVGLKLPASVSLRLRGEDATSYINSCMAGGYAKADQGKMYQQPVKSSYRLALTGTATYNLVPWTALHRNTGAQDGLFLALEYLGKWSFDVAHEAGGPLTAAMVIPELKAGVLQSGQRLEMPWVTVGVFSGGLDAMAASLYDWQYEYLWDYTNSDYHARSRCATWWFYCSRNLQEQFTARLAKLDIDTSDSMRAMGYEMLWDDAGWSSYPGEGVPPDGYGSVFTQTYEGPDFSQTQRYLRKTGMRWLLWFVGRPPAGVLDGKIGAWGDFEWRTDGVSLPNMDADRRFRAEVKRFLDVHPGSSFHTCSGGSNYSHTFEIGGRYSSYNYLSDLGRGPYVNHYFSYLEPPDRWGDSLIAIASIYGKKDGSSTTMEGLLAARGGSIPRPDELRYVRDTARGMLTAVPNPCWVPPQDSELARRDMELYRFFREEGLAGRWSYMFHPAVQGDPEYYYYQRTSHDRRKACIILAHRTENAVVVCPRELLPEVRYVVGFDSTQATTERTGADLMAAGIAIKDQKPGELIYLNLPHRPGSGEDKVPPQAPGRVLVRRETNIGHSGMGLYWSAGTDNNWISYYEVRRDGKTLEKVAIGNYFFDHAEGWDGAREYAVRTVDGDGNASGWTVAEPTAGEPATFSALGGHFARPGRDGWSAETAAEGRAFEPMAWVPPAKNPAADFGGTPNQRGGVEGYWEGPGGSRVGRGWQQASKTEDCIRTWTAPKAGTVRIAGRAMREYYHRAHGGPLKVRILRGGEPVWPETDWAAVAVGDLTGVAHDIALSVAAGDAIRFVLGRGTMPEHDLVAWMPRIAYDEPPAAASAAGVVRILCGSTTAYTDRCGNVWAADQQFAGGEPLATTERIEEASPTSDDYPLYQKGRVGKDFSYSIAVPTGLYAVRLKCAEPRHAWMFERPFNVSINGCRVLTDFDVVQAAKGPRRAVERSFRNVVPDSEGKIVLRFTAGWNPHRSVDGAMVQAIEILPEQRPAIRINAGSDAEFVDWSGCVWRADAHFSGGTAIRSAEPVVHASPTLHDQGLYRTARSGNAFSYSLTALPGLYTVHLKFAELWFAKAGERPTDITINGRLVCKSWDPASAAGRTGMAADIRIENISPDKEGRVVIGLRGTGGKEAILQAIEIE